MKYLLIGLLAVLSISTVTGQKVEGKYSAAMIAQAKEAGEAIVFEQGSIPLGEIKKGSYPEMTFRFLNISNEVLEYNFFDVCSCSMLTHDEYAKIKPGEEGSFHIKFDSKERDDEEPVEVNFELKNIDKRNNYPYFYTVDYTFKFN